MLESLGFATQCASETATLKTYTFGNGAAAFRAVFHQQDRSVQVRITL